MPDDGLELNKTLKITTESRKRADSFELRRRYRPWWLSHRGGHVFLRNARIVNVRRFLSWVIKAAGFYRAIAILTLNAVLFFVALELAATAAIKFHLLVSRPASEPLIGE